MAFVLYLLFSRVKDDLLDKVLCNLGRINHKLGNHQKAIQAFKAIRKQIVKIKNANEPLLIKRSIV